MEEKVREDKEDRDRKVDKEDRDREEEEDRDEKGTWIRRGHGGQGRLAQGGKQGVRKVH